MGIESNRELFSVACVFFVKSQLELGLAEASSPMLPSSGRWTYIRLNIHYCTECTYLSFVWVLLRSRRANYVKSSRTERARRPVVVDASCN